MSASGDPAMCGADGRRPIYRDPAGGADAAGEDGGEDDIFQGDGGVARWGHVDYEPSRDKAGTSRVRIV